MTSDKLKALREKLQREVPSALADLSMTDDEYSGVEEWARCCPACGQRNDCEHKLLGRALVKIELLNEVVKDSTDLHNVAKQQAFQLRQLKGILEEMFKICPCMCNTAIDYDCPKCEARRMLKAMEEQSQKMGSFCDTEKG